MMVETLGTAVGDAGKSAPAFAAEGASYGPAASAEELYALLAALKQRDYRFTTITPLSHATVNSRNGKQWARPESVLVDIFGWSRVFHQDDLPTELFQLMQQAKVLSTHEDGWRSTVRVSTLNTPASQNMAGLLDPLASRPAAADMQEFNKSEPQTGTPTPQYFMHSAYPTNSTDSVFFGPDTYRYIREIDHAITLRKLQSKAGKTQAAGAQHSAAVGRAVDIGCGAGPGAVCIALHYPVAQVYAVDINAMALKLTEVNARAAGTPNVHAVYSNLLTSVSGQFDLISANPPYLLDAEQRAYRHGGGSLGQDLSLAMVKAALPRLNKGGSLLLYTGAAVVNGCDVFMTAAQEILAAFSRHTPLSWQYAEIDPDVFGEELLNPGYASTDRIAAVLLHVRLQ